MSKSMIKQLVIFTVLLAVLTLTTFLLYSQFHLSWMLPVFITLLTTFYHFAMRLTVGQVITRLFRNRDFPQNKLGFRQFRFEETLYRKLLIRKWKGMLPTARPLQFDLKAVAPEELLHNVMQAELIHRLNMVLSFLPLLLIIPFGEPVVFILTSVLACLVDLAFVIIQRYNRPRVMKYLKLTLGEDVDIRSM